MADLASKKNMTETTLPEANSRVKLTRVHKICYCAAGMLFIITALNELAIITISKNGWFSLGGIVALLLLPELKKLSFGKISIEK